MEARVGIEPTHKGFADLSLTTWVPRLLHHTRSASRCRTHKLTCGVYRRGGCFWSGRPGSNRRHLPWQGSTLPLSYSRPASTKYSQNMNRLQRTCHYCGGGVVGAAGPSLQAAVARGYLAEPHSAFAAAELLRRRRWRTHLLLEETFACSGSGCRASAAAGSQSAQRLRARYAV